MNLLEKAAQEMKIMKRQWNQKRKKEEEIDYKYFPKMQVIDKDVIFTGSGQGVHRMIPYWHDIL